MANDVKISLGLDANDLFSGLDIALSKINEQIKGLPDVGDAISADIPSAQNKLNSFINQQKQLLVSLRLQGQEGSESYAIIEKSIIEATSELKKLDDATKAVDNSFKNIDVAPVSTGFKGLANEAKDIGSKIKDSFNMQNLSAGLVGGLAGGLASGGIQTVISGVASIGKNIFDAAMQADEFGDTLEVAFKQQGIEDVDGEIEKVSKSTRKLADDLGLPTQRTRELATTVATMGGVSGKQAEELTKLSAGLETFSGGAVKGEAVALAFSKGLADPEGAAAIEKLAKKYPQLADTLRSNIAPAEKMKIANDLLGESFKTVADQQSDAGGTFNKLSNALSAAYETIGTGIMDVINMVIPIFTETLGPAFSDLSETIGGVFSRVWSIVQPVLALIGGAIIGGIVVVINQVVVGLNTLYSIWISVFDAVKNAIMPLIDTFKQAFGLDGEFGKGLDVVKLFTDTLGNITDILGEVGKIVAEFGGLLVEFIITPFQGIIEVIADVVRSIGGWISSNDSNTESVKQSGTAVQQTKGFIDTLREAFNNIRGTIGGVREAFTQIKITVGEFWDAITQLDLKKALDAFTGFGDKISTAYDKGFNATKAAIQNTNQVVKEGGDEAARAAAARAAAEKVAADKAAAEKKKKDEEEKKRLAALNKGKTQEAKSELEQLRIDLKDQEEAIKSSNFFKLQAAKDAGEDVKVAQARLDQEANAKLREFLNTRLANVKDANTTLTQEQATSIIKPSDKKGETIQDVLSFYTDNISKFSKDSTVETKYKIDIPTFKEQLKEVETISKDFAATAEKLVPITISGSSEELAQVQQDVINFQEFLKAQNLEIAQLQQEAQIAGNEEAAQKFAEAINKNVQSINLLESRVKTFAEKTKEAQKQNTLEYQIATALQTSLLDTFNADKLRKERETNEAIRKERLGALDAEENDLNKSLAKREISAEEYAAKLAEINNGRQKAQEETEVTILERLKQAGDKVVGDVLKTQGAAFTEQAKKMEGGSKIMYEAMGGLATSFGALAASGKATLKDFAGASIDIAVQAMMKMIPIWTAEIFATSVAELGVGGLAVAAGLQIVLMGLVSAARSAGGFKDGVVGLDGAGTETSDSIPAWLSRGESVITARATKNNKEELEFMNRTGLSIAEFYKMRMPSTSVSVTPEGDLIREVRKLREETRGLGVRIQRNTSVEVSGVLTADSKSINALIVEQKRRSARRG